ncbi:HAD superfamily hydrolase (TIGR01450 family) [Arcanobacterium wilhelmae]|uniref:HAD superfamily hydrolase (TIGR01450 family) n=1 Tax=Arcanobacterium wilhelmae TaxID=1803177 RepID=A0ABT9N890_9ACTO|nr:HAD-IIA family hydrolase [Arcanobacterium wilhelmae]MDP9799928.1 HAD superfamily hydrolase (TIGR01450 family) [Arcanobacterium wilhelmae]WFN91063.1 HAD-IIA family hydrolase [Arcanobacterium wilhelmae]
MTTQYSGPALVEIADLMLTDLDGVAYLGQQEAPYAAEGIAAARERGVHPVYVTNNSSRPPAKVAQHLSSLGIPTEATDVINTAITGVMQVAQHVPAGSKVLAVGGEGVFEALRDAGFDVVTSAEDDPAAILQGFAEHVSWVELSEIALAIRKGALYVATNLDATMPRERGETIGNGSLVAAVVNATGVEPLSAGKPAPDMYKLAVERTGLSSPIAIGDRLDTDMVGANAAGIISVHVLTGVSQVRDVLLASAQARPRVLARDLRDLGIAYAPVDKDGDVWRCETAKACVKDGQLLVDDAPIAGSLTLNQYRAAASAAWEASDAGVTFDAESIPAVVSVR